MKTLIVIQATTAVLTLFRLFLLVQIFGSDTLGSFSYELSLVMMLTFVTQIVINSGVQVDLIRQRDSNESRFFGCLFAFLMFYYIVMIFVVVISMRVFNWNINAIEVVVACFFSLLNSIFELKALVEQKLAQYYSSLLVSAFGSVLFLLVVSFTDLKAQVGVILPVISFGSETVFFMFVNFNKVKKGFNLRLTRMDILNFYCIYRKSWSLSLIPFQNTFFDFFVKSCFIRFSDKGTLGLYQMIVSMEALLGNVVMGPIYRSRLIRYTTNGFNDKEFRRDILSIIILVISSSLALLVASFISNRLNIESEIVEMFPILAVVLIGRIVWFVWGFIAQRGLSIGFTNHITKVEIFSRVLLSLSTMIFLIASFNERSYVYSIFFVGILMLFLSYRTFKEIREAS